MQIDTKRYICMLIMILHCYNNFYYKFMTTIVRQLCREKEA